MMPCERRKYRIYRTILQTWMISNIQSMSRVGSHQGPLSLSKFSIKNFVKENLDKVSVVTIKGF